MKRRDMNGLMRLAPVIPVLTIEDVARAVPVAAALVAGGLPVLEVTLRTPAALDVIRAMKTVPGAVVGAGTVIDVVQFGKAVDAGAEFVVSPGLTTELALVARRLDTPFLPGIANASDIMRGLDHGIDRFKFFPAEASGGIAALKALSGPFGHVRFCPTGGITANTAARWLELDVVLCIGGSWLLQSGPLDIGAIEQAAHAARRLG